MVMPPLFRYADPGVRVGVALWPDQLVFGDVLVRNAAADQLWNRCELTAETSRT
jgi:hypothetical protein